ncbi:MAG: hypothetical protein H6815_09135 [Phycisphaeraceae bacterium]|nr:hypothetical protein [Phycisphaerales bacterium]MCB9860603.1 hypothetical protein [Phycisphaeraceae bacterium]
MKPKGASFIDQHIEKVVVGVFALILLMVLGTQFLLQPNKIDVGGGRSVTPDRAFEGLEEKARELEGKLNTSTPEMPAPLELGLLDRLQQVRSGGSMPRREFAFAGYVPSFGESEIGTGGTAGSVQVAVKGSIIAPESPVAFANLSTLDPFQIAAYEGLAEALGGMRQPMDVASVSVEAQLDIDALRAQLEADPDGDGAIQPMPTSWWRTSLEVFGVAMERQELRMDGSWSDPVLVDTFPLFTNLVDRVEKREDLTRTMLESYATQAAELSTDIRHPAYLATIAGPEWRQPSIAFAAMNDDSADSTRVMLTNRNKLIEDRRQKLASARRDPEDPWVPWWDRTPEQRDPEFVYKKPQNTNAPDPTNPDDRGRGANPSQPEFTRQERLLIQHERTLLELEEKIWETGWRPEGFETETGNRLDEVNALLSNTMPVTLWKHDFTVLPGATYRYRTAVMVNNPAFQREAFLAPEQVDLAKQPVLTGEFSEWTEPVTVPSMQYYFVTAAQEGTQGVINKVQASFEVYQFYYGYYRKATTTLEPGQRLFATTQIPSDLTEFDLSGITPEPIPSSEDASSETSEIGFSNPNRESLNTDPSEENVERTGTPLPTRRDVELSVLLLDVSRTLANQTEAVVLNAMSGQIERRDPNSEKQQRRYKLIATSAEAGKTQGKPVPAKKRTIIAPPDPVSNDPGGGGGGGGLGGGGGGG